MAQTPAIGTIGWVDLTVADAPRIRDFYKAVAGWTTSEVPMGDYADFCMHPPAEGAPPSAGICHARGPNADIPPSWLIYIVVADLDASLAACRAEGGEVVRPAKDLGGGMRMAIIRDPAGAVSALFQQAG